MINKVILIGRLGADTECQEAKNGKQYTKLSIATSTSFKDAKGEWQEKTEWHPVIAWWNIRAQKGDVVYVEGELNYISGDNSQKNAFITAKNVKVVYNIQKENKVPQTANFQIEGDLPF